MRKALFLVLVAVVMLTLLGATCEGSGGDGARPDWTPLKDVTATAAPSKSNVTSEEAAAAMRAVQCEGCACWLNNQWVMFPAGECVPENANLRDK